MCGEVGGCSSSWCCARSGHYDLVVNGRLGQAAVASRFVGPEGRGQDLVWRVDISGPSRQCSAFTSSVGATTSLPTGPTSVKPRAPSTGSTSQQSPCCQTAGSPPPSPTPRRPTATTTHPRHNCTPRLLPSLIDSSLQHGPWTRAAASGVELTIVGSTGMVGSRWGLLTVHSNEGDRH